PDPVAFHLQGEFDRVVSVETKKHHEGASCFQGDTQKIDLRSINHEPDPAAFHLQGEFDRVVSLETKKHHEGVSCF
ncbi:MAG: hypothetical protein IKV39_03390, partial [Clostridia bacterium]|nr:hypothetical protein [Clostridia bacterium]